MHNLCRVSPRLLRSSAELCHQERPCSSRQLLNRRGLPTGNAAKAAPSKPKAATEVFEAIVERLRENGEMVVVRAGVETGVDVLLEAGIDWEAVVATFTARLDLFQISAKDWRESFQFLSSFGLDSHDVLRIIGRAPELLRKPKSQLSNSVEILMDLGIRGNHLPHTIKQCPSLLLHVDYNHAKLLVNIMKNFFSHDQVIAIIRREPRVLFRNAEELESKYEYIYYEMGMESPAFATCRRWVTLPIHVIRARHEFLARTGAYVKPNPKRPLLTAANPRLFEILDSPNAVFARRVAGVTLEEWDVFRDMYERQLRLEKAANWQSADDDEAAAAAAAVPDIDNEFSTSKPYFKNNS